jgi:hypothetical protein
MLRAGDTTMSTTTITPDLAEHVIATLRAHETELRQAGIPRLSAGRNSRVTSRHLAADRRTASCGSCHSSTV